MLVKKYIPDSGATSPAKKRFTTNQWGFVAVAASMMIALLMSFLAIDFRGRLKASESALNDHLSGHKQIAEDFPKVTEQLERLEVDYAIVDNPAFRKVVLGGTNLDPSALAVVYWNETSREVYLSVHVLKDLSAEQQFQLWATIGGKSVDVGVFDSTKGRLLRMRNVNPGATAFAVTVEAKGGATTPTTETIQVTGNVAGG